MACKHYYYFGERIQSQMSGDSLNKENWDILRNDDAEGPFSIEKDVEQYEQNNRGAVFYENVAKIILSELQKRNSANKVISLGVGKGILEWHLKNLKPDLTVECTDYTEKAIEQIKRVFIKVDAAYTFDMLEGDYSQFDKDAFIIMFRVSTEFNAKQWTMIFNKMNDSGVKNIIFVPVELCTRKDMVREKYNHMKRIIKHRKDIFCGWLYTEKEIKAFFRGNREKPNYSVDTEIAIENTAVFFLKHT